jgi:hypothetical protein
VRSSLVMNAFITGVTQVPFPVAAAEAAGLALGSIRDGDDRARLTADAMVMAYASMFGCALVYTSDLDDLLRLAKFFPSVRVLSI